MLADTPRRAGSHLRPVACSVLAGAPNPLGPVGPQQPIPTLADANIALLRPARKGEKPRDEHRFFKPLRQVIESINNTLKTQLDLERHGGRTIAGIASRVLQRILALTAAIWHNDRTNRPILRSLTAYDH